MKFLLIVSSLACLLAAPVANASNNWDSRIPNGATYDCAACHTSGSTRNSFGTAFRSAGNRWTTALSALDSDGDGFTNGQELGDPRGVWVSGAAVPIPGASVGNPGSSSSRPTLTPPALSITSPANGANFTAPYVGPVAVTPGNAAAINQVQFYAGTTLLGTDTTSPFSLAVNLSAGSYSLTARAIDYLGASNTSATVSITVGTAAVAPSITTQPASQTVTAGANVSFTVAASGTAPLSYQWRKGGANIAGATAATLSLTAVTTAAAGSYDVLVSNSAGSAASAAATLTVNPAPVAPVVTTQPASQTVTAGANVTFTVAATGTAPLSYQWRKNGANISGATSATLTLSGVGVADSGNYTAFVSNSAGSATSAAATLTVNPSSVATAPDDQSAPAMASNGDTTLVVWQDARSGEGYDIYAARLSSAGALQNTILIGSAAGNQVQPRVACNGTNFLVVWADYAGGNSAQIVGARVSLSGSLLDAQGLVVCTDAHGQSQPAVASDGANYLVAWQDFRGTSADIYGAGVTSAGAVLDPAGFVISQAANQEINPAVAGNASGYLVVWQDSRSGSGYDIYGTRVSSAGAVASPSGVAISAAAFDQVNPAASGNGTDFLVIWQDFRNGASFDIYGTVVTSAGAVSSPNGVAVCAAAGDQFNPVLANAGTGYLAVWTDIRNGANYVIYGARVSSAGSVTDANGIVISTGSGEHYHPAVARNGTGWWTAWQDYRNGDSSDLYGSRVASAGTVSDASGVLLTPAVVVVPPQTPTITWATPASISYGTALSGSQLRATASVPGTFQYSPVAGTVLAAGARTLTVTFTPTDTTAYTTATATVPLTVNRASLTIRADNKSKVAGQPNPALTATYTGFVNGDTVASLTTPVSLTTTATASSPAGTYPIVPSGAASPNYIITFVNGTLTVTDAGAPSTGTFVNSSSITIRDNAPAAIYPSTISVAGMQGTITKVTVNLANLTHKRPDDLDVLLVGPAGQQVLLMSDAGGSEDTERVTLTFDDAATAAIPDTSRLRTTTYRPANYGGGDTFAAPAPAGPYGATLSAFNGSNPNGSWKLFILDDASGEEQGSLAGGWSLTITTATPSKQTPVITWAAPAAIVYGTVLSGTQLNATANVPGTFQYTPASGSMLAAGANQTLSVVFTPNDTQAYTNANATVSLSVNKQPLTVTANSAARPYGAANPTFTGTLAGVVNNDAITASFTCAAITASPVGGYAITPALSDPNGRLANYTVASANGTLTVNPAPLTIRADDKTKAAGQANPPLTATYQGFVNGDTAGSLTTPVSLTTTATTTSPAGAYPIVASAAASPNYTITFVNGTLTVTPPVLVGLAIQPASASIAVAQTRQFSVVATYSDGSSTTVGSGVTWTSSNTSVASVNASGLATGLTAGTTTLSASFGGQSATASLTVTSAVTPGTKSFTNSASISIRDNTSASVYPATINVSGLSGSITKVTVKLVRLTHKRPDDLDILLIGPGGQKVLLMSDAGGSEDAKNLTLTFDDVGTTAMPDSRRLRSGTYRPSNYGSSDTFRTPAPAGPYGAALSAFDGTNPNGNWQLYIMDDTSGEENGALAGGWSITITTGQSL